MPTTKEKKAWQEWLDLCEQTKSATGGDFKKETPKQKDKRIKSLLNDFVKFCKYYFDHLIDSDFGWFHKKAAKEILKHKNKTFILEWAREHAKSVFSCVFVPMWLKARGELTGVVVVSANAEKAKVLLSDLQAQLVANQKYINDFGEQQGFGDWRSEHFSTRDGLGFWAFGRGQSPRGIRKAALRPNLAIVDDIDDKEIIANQDRVAKAVAWVWEDLYPAMPISGSRMIIAGNRIHPKSILAHIVGDIDENTLPNPKHIHIKVYATENHKHEKALIGEKGARPAWKERYTIKMLASKFDSMPNASVLGEYYHTYVQINGIFKREWLRYGERPDIEEFESIVVYTDPSYKDTKKSDYKATIAIGKHRKTKLNWLLGIWANKTTITKMVKANYRFFGEYDDKASYWMEANLIQDTFRKEFDDYGIKVGYFMPIQMDYRKKPNKDTRIAAMQPYFENGYIIICKDLIGSKDLNLFKEQLFEFPNCKHDDIPDALEGGLNKLRKMSFSSNFKPRKGKFKKSNRRR